MTNDEDIKQCEEFKPRIDEMIDVYPLRKRLYKAEGDIELLYFEIEKLKYDNDVHADMFVKLLSFMNSFSSLYGDIIRKGKDE